MPALQERDVRTFVTAALLDRVVAYFNPQRVILVGSVARGDFGPDSDIDLLVSVDDDTPQERLTLKAGQESRRGYHAPVDVIPVRESIFQLNAEITGTLSRAAASDGIVVYDRP
jgi:predicted nucleotidyltransferase